MVNQEKGKITRPKTVSADHEAVSVYDVAFSDAMQEGLNTFRGEGYKISTMPTLVRNLAQGGSSLDFSNRYISSSCEIIGSTSEYKESEEGSLEDFKDNAFLLITHGIITNNPLFDVDSLRYQNSLSGKANIAKVLDHSHTSALVEEDNVIPFDQFRNQIRAPDLDQYAVKIDLKTAYKLAGDATPIQQLTEEQFMATSANDKDGLVADIIRARLGLGTRDTDLAKSIFDKLAVVEGDDKVLPVRFNYSMPQPDKTIGTPYSGFGMILGLAPKQGSSYHIFGTATPASRIPFENPNKYNTPEDVVEETSPRTRRVSRLSLFGQSIAKAANFIVYKQVPEE